MYGGGYSDLSFSGKGQFSHKRTCNVDMISQGASFLHLNRFFEFCFRLKAEELYWRETTPLLGSGGFLPPNHPLSPAPLGATAPRPRKIAIDNRSLLDKCKFGAQNSLSAFNKMQSEVSAGFTATDKAQSETSDTSTAFNKMPSEASDGFAATDKVQSEGSDGFAVFNKALSEVSDVSTATNNILSETSDSLADSHKHESEGQENKSPVKGNKEFL